MRTLTQLRIDLRDILECDHGDLVVREYIDPPVEPGHAELQVGVKRDALSESMFDVEQFEHIIKSLTPAAVTYELEVH